MTKMQQGRSSRSELRLRATAAAVLALLSGGAFAATELSTGLTMTPAAETRGSYSVPVNSITRYFDNYYSDAAGISVTGSYLFAGGTADAPATMGALLQGPVTVSGTLGGKLYGGNNTIGVWVNGTLDVLSGGSLTAEGSSGTAGWAVVAAGAASNAGNVSATGGSGANSIALQMTSGFANTGNVSVQGGGTAATGSMSLGLYLAGIVSNRGVFESAGGGGNAGIGTQTIGTFTNAGTLTLQGGSGSQAAGLFNGGTFTNTAGGTVTMTGGSGQLAVGWLEQGTFKNEGSVTLTGGTGTYAYGMNLNGSAASFTNAAGKTIKIVGGSGSNANGLRTDTGTSFVNRGVILAESISNSGVTAAVFLGSFENAGIARANYGVAGSPYWAFATQGSASNSGTFTVYSNGLSVSGGTFANTGTFEVVSDRSATGVTVASGAEFVNENILKLGGASVENAGLYIKGTFENSGSVTVNGVYGLYHSQGTVTNSGTITSTGGSDYGIRSESTWIEEAGAVLNLNTNGMIQTMSGSALFGGTVIGTGYGVLHNYGLVENAGDMSVTNDSSRDVASVYNASSDADFTNRGTLTLSGRYAFKNTDSASTVNYGTLTAGAGLGMGSDLAIENVNGGTLTNETSGTIVFKAGGIQNYADGIVFNKGSLQTAQVTDFENTYFAIRNGGSWTEDSGSSLTLRDKGVANVGKLILKGSTVIAGAYGILNSTDGTNRGTILQSGTVTVTGNSLGAGILNAAQGSFENSGTMHLKAAGFENAGSVRNSGSIYIEASDGWRFASGSAGTFVNTTGSLSTQSDWMFDTVADGTEHVNPIGFEVIKSSGEELVGALNDYAVITQGGSLRLEVNDNWSAGTATFEGGSVTFTDVKAGSILSEAVTNAFENAWGSAATLAFTGTNEGSVDIETEVRRDSFGITQANSAVAAYGTGALLKSIDLVTASSQGTVEIGSDITDSIGFRMLGGMTDVTVASGKTLTLLGDGTHVSFDAELAARKGAETGKTYAVTAFRTDAGGRLTLGSSHNGVTALQGGYFSALDNAGELKVVAACYRTDRITNSRAGRIEVDADATLHAATLEGSGTLVNAGTVVADAGMIRSNISTSGVTVIKDYAGGISSTVEVTDGATLMAETYNNLGITRTTNGTLVIGGAALRERYLLANLDVAREIVAAGGTVGSRVLEALAEAESVSVSTFSLRSGSETLSVNGISLGAESADADEWEADARLLAAEAETDYLEAELPALTDPGMDALQERRAAVKASLNAIKRAGAAYEQIRMGTLAHDRMLNHSLTAMTASGGFRADAFYAHTKTPGFSSDSSGAVLGWDGSEGDLHFGAAMTLQKGDADAGAAGNDTESNSISIYAAYPMGGTVLSGGFTYTDGVNELSASGFSGEGKTDFYQLGVRLSKPFTGAGFDLTPYIGADWGHFRVKGFSVSDGTETIAVGGVSDGIWQIPVGVDVKKDFRIGENSFGFEGGLSVVWQPGLGENGRSSAEIPYSDKVFGDLRIGGVWHLSCADVSLAYSGSVGNIRDISHGVSLRGIIRF